MNGNSTIVSHTVGDNLELGNPKLESPEMGSSEDGKANVSNSHNSDIESKIESKAFERKD